ncbi:MULTISPECIES: hypothetical protein [unclassified Moorena]|uniref:hypothetical protein n=1 Tax=unclassified Moorena TaxID=2683338 RepID=UPI0013FFAB63|nr:MULTISPECIES: hypothetical protein [unclassified Moorena]NEO16468.1 hypothetical protein [Moorena sp. SIO3E8]NEQ00450.1 hypothetical protein [Moorena sp. SIO3F7]
MVEKLSSMLAVLSGYRGSTEATFSRSVHATQSVSFPPALASIADSGSNTSKCQSHVETSIFIKAL